MTKYKTQMLKKLQLQVEELEQRINKYKQEIIQEMEECGLNVYEDSNIRAVYIDGYTRIKLDMDKIKNQYNEVYNDCLREALVKPQVRIEIKGDNR